MNERIGNNFVAKPCAMDLKDATIIMIPAETLQKLQATLEEILKRLIDKPAADKPNPQPKFLTALQFMEAIDIKRTKFDELVKSGKIKIIKKKRKIYVPATEVERYFNDPSIL